MEIVQFGIWIVALNITLHEWQLLLKVQTFGSQPFFKVLFSVERTSLYVALCLHLSKVLLSNYSQITALDKDQISRDFLPILDPKLVSNFNLS